MRLTYLGAVNLQRLEAENSLPITTRDALITLPNGGYDQDRGMPVFLPNTFNTRLILKESDNIVRTMREIQKRLSYGRTLLRAKDRDGLELQTWVKVKDVQRDANVKTYKAMQPLVVTMRQDYPYWLASEDEPLYADTGLYADSGLDADAGTRLTQTIDATLESATITNNGTAVIRKGTITIEMDASGTIENLRITNTQNSTYIEYSGTLVADDTLVIDLLNRTALLNGTDVFSSILVPDTADYWLPLELGANSITWVSDSISGTHTCYWQYSKHYL